MNHHEMLMAAGLAWRYYDLQHEQTAPQEADEARLVTEDGEAMLILRREGQAGMWLPVDSDTLTADALARVPVVTHPDEIDPGLMLDLEGDHMPLDLWATIAAQPPEDRP
jgi:hypothetical protein